MGFGDFMKGVQGGIGTMDDLYNAKQKRKLYDYAISDSENAMDAKDRSRARAKLPPLKRLMGEDPFLFRFLNKLGGGDEAIDTQGDVNPPLETLQAPDITAEPMLETPDITAQAIPGYADGGALPDQWDYTEDPKKPNAKAGSDSPEAIKERAARNRANTNRPAPPPDAVNAPAEAPSAASRIRGALALGEDAGKLRRGINAVGKAAALPALAATGATVALTPTEQYRKRFGLETKDPSLMGDIGVRTLGAASDLGNVLTFGQAGRFYRDLQPEDQAAAPAAAPQQAIPTAAAAPEPMAGSPRRAGGPGPKAVPDKLVAAQDPENIDWSKIKAIDVPQMSTQDWQQYREQNIQELVDRGMSYAEAWDQVDQQTIAVQQRGFNNFAKQGLALLQMGRTEEAGAAIRAAFQYIASTTDMEVGVHNGHLVAFGVDEQTGKPEGTPVVVTPQLLEGIMLQFQDPKNFANLQNDRKKLDQQDRGLDLEQRKLDEVMIPAMENEGAYQRAAALDKMGGSGGSVLKPADVDRVRTQFFDPKANELVMNLPEEQRMPGLVEAITRALEEDYINGAGSPAQLVVEIQRVLMQPDGPAKIMRTYGQ